MGPLRRAADGDPETTMSSRRNERSAHSSPVLVSRAGTAIDCDSYRLQSADGSNSSATGRVSPLHIQGD